MALAERVRGSFGPINKNKAAAGWPEWRRGSLLFEKNGVFYKIKLVLQLQTRQIEIT
jgi:hypothetical protein